MIGQHEFLLQCLGVLGGSVPQCTAQDDHELTLELPLGNELRLDVSVAWDEDSGRFLSIMQCASEGPDAAALCELLLSPTFERATLAARWMKASACPIAPVIGEGGALQWQAWLPPIDRGVGSFADFAAWATAFHTLFGVEADKREGDMQLLPPSPEDWLELDRLLELQWSPGQWAHALATHSEGTGQWIDNSGLIYNFAWPDAHQSGMATVVLQDMGPHLGLPGSDLGPTLARLNGLLHPQSCCLGLDGRHNLRLMATLAPATAEQDLGRLPELADAVRSLLLARRQSSDSLIDQALHAGWVPDTLVFR
jgi:hypothetical protein